MLFCVGVNTTAVLTAKCDSNVVKLQLIRNIKPCSMNRQGENTDEWYIVYDEWKSTVFRHPCWLPSFWSITVDIRLCVNRPAVGFVLTSRAVFTIKMHRSA